MFRFPGNNPTDKEIPGWLSRSRREFLRDAGSLALGSTLLGWQPLPAWAGTAKHVTNAGILGHYVASASLTTGVYETLNNFSVVPPEHPTVFEYLRKDLNRPMSNAWVVAPSNDRPFPATRR